MKAKIIFIFIVFFTSIDGFGQGLSEDLRNYYTFVNQAEICVVNADYKKAILHYEQAFQNKKNPFLVDIHNQALCSALLYQDDLAQENLRLLVAYGYRLEQLMNIDGFNAIIDRDFKGELRELENAEKMPYDFELRQVYDSLLIADQEFRLLEGSYAVYGDTIASIDHSARRKVLELIAKHGFPTEHLIGVHLDFDYEPFKMIVIHSQVGSTTEDTIHFIETLFDAVYAGDLDSRVGAQLLVGAMGNDIYGIDLTGLVRYGYEDPVNDIYEVSDWGILRIDREKEQQIDLERDKIGLCSLEESRKKAIFTKKNELGFRLSPGSNFRTYMSAEWDDYIEHKKMLVFPK